MQNPSGKIEIPLEGRDEVLEIEVANLPDVTEAILILQQQTSKISIWIQTATAYYCQQKHDAFEAIMIACLEFWSQERVKASMASYEDGDKDRIKALDLLAIFYVRRASASKNREKRRDYLARAAQRFTEVDKTEGVNKRASEYEFHLLGRAYCCLIDGKNDQAEAQFNFVHQQQTQTGKPENIASLLGKACIEFNKKDASSKRAALGYYKKALQTCPSAPADVRLGLAICFYKLNMLEKAEEAFTRALKLEPKCVGALIGLAVIELNKKTNQSIKRGIDYVSRAYKIDSTDPMVLTLLADHFFYSNQHDKVIKLSTRALENTDNEAMQAQACYQLGRAYHKLKEYDNACEYYYKATQFGGTQFYLAHYGLGQMHIHKMEFDAAIQAFETVLKSNPDNHETLKVLASLYARPNPKESESKRASLQDKARAYLKKVTDNKPQDVEAWVELASLTEQHDTQLALSAYRTSIKLYKDKGTPVPPEIYNNTAALLWSTESLSEAEQYYNLALERCEEETPNNRSHYESIIYTIRYNLGRLYESKYEMVKASTMYKDILVQHPMYLDCYLRLGCMERDKGDFFQASDKYKEIFRFDPDNPDAWTLIANLHFAKLEFTPCQKKFERILERTSNSNPIPDLYSIISIGNVWLQTQYLTSSVHKDRLAKQRSLALKFFKHGLHHDAKNIYAANGIGCILAINGKFNEARDVFSQVREATADFPDVWINLAHIYVEQKQYSSAVQMYENCLKKFYNNTSTDILQYIARAHFKAKKFSECKKALLKARYLNPQDPSILLNLAKTLKTDAKLVLQDNKSAYSAVVNAEFELKLSHVYFKTHNELKERSQLIDQTTVVLEAKECDDLLVQVEATYKVNAEARDREERMKLLEHQEFLRLELARKASEEQQRLLEEQKRKDELETKRKELLKKQEEAKQKILLGDHIDENENVDVRGKKRKKGAKENKQKRTKEVEGETSGRYKSRAILSSDSDSSSEVPDTAGLEEDEIESNGSSDHED